MNTVNIIAAIAIAVLSGMGIGSGGLFSIWLTAVAGMPQLAAQGMNLLFFMFSGGASMLLHLSRRKIYWRAVLLLSSTGILGTVVGSVVAGLLPVKLIRVAFGMMLIGSGIAVTVGDRRKKKNAENESGQ